MTQRGDDEIRDRLTAACETAWPMAISNADTVERLLPAVRAIADEAEERGRQSVGLGDFLPNPCGDEYSSYPHYIAEQYGDYVTCSRSRGHDGQHEHSDSGMTWSTR